MKRPIKKTRRKINKKLTEQSHGFFKIILLLIACLFLIQYVSSQFRTIVETPRSEVSKIPSRIEQQRKQEATTSASFKVPILMYHYVEYIADKNDTIRQSLNIIPSVFEEQVKTLVTAGYTFLTVSEVGDALRNNRGLPQKSVVLTFDDGHWDTETVILPILKKYNIRVTAYIVPGFIGKSDFLSDKQLQELIESRLVEIGAHTVHHIHLKGKLTAVAKYEIEESKAMLEKNYNVRVVSFAYPDGAFDEQAIEIVKNAGFTTAVSTVPGNMQNYANRAFLFRIRPGQKTGEELLNYINQDYIISLRQ